MSFGGPVVAGTRIGNESSEVIPESSSLRPILNQIIIEPLEWRPSDIISVVYRGRTLRGKVKAVGPGKYGWKYDGRKGKRTKRWLSKHFVPTQVKVGDIVELGGLELEGYLHKTFIWGTKEHVVCTEDDVAAILDP
jgi:hypothetical protein